REDAVLALPRAGGVGPRVADERVRARRRLAELQPLAAEREVGVDLLLLARVDGADLAGDAERLVGAGEPRLQLDVRPQGGLGGLHGGMLSPGTPSARVDAAAALAGARRACAAARGAAALVDAAGRRAAAAGALAVG